MNNEKFKILIVNDDGINSWGIKRLAREALRHGEVWVIAPDSQRSAMSHRINYTSAIYLKEQKNFLEGVKAFACDGSPADCVRVGMRLIGQKPNYIFSGINKGFNIASDIQYSATVGAALEGAFWGIPSIAFSEEDGYCHEVIEKYIGQLMDECMEKTLSKTEVWNVNFPSCGLAECKGIMRECKVSYDEFYKDKYEMEQLEDGKYCFRLQMGRNWAGSENTDLFAVCNKYVSVGRVHNLG